jgi:hypothetical protein
MIANINPMVITEFLRALLQANDVLYSIFIPTLAAELSIRPSTVYSWFNGHGDLPLRHLAAVVRNASHLGYDLFPLRDLISALFDAPPLEKPLRSLQGEALILLGRLQEQNLTDENLNAADATQIMELSGRFQSLSRHLQQSVIKQMTAKSLRERGAA